MSLVATGPYMKPLAKLADMLAACPSVQARMGLTGLTDAVEQALARIPYPVLEHAELQDLRPLFPTIVLSCGDKWALESQAAGGMNYLRPTIGGSSIAVQFADTAAFPDSLRESFKDFGNWLGAVLSDLAAEAAKSGQLAIVGVRQEMPIVMCSQEEAAVGGLYLQASFFVDWN